MKPKLMVLDSLTPYSINLSVRASQRDLDIAYEAHTDGLLQVNLDMKE